jgi:hypothetical protein
MKSLAAVSLVLSLSALCSAPQQQANPNKWIEMRTAAMSSAASAWLTSLPADLRARANPSFDSEDRKRWAYTEAEAEHGGVAFGEQSPDERRLQDLLLREALSQTGYLKVHAIVALQEVIERDPGNYFMTVFGDPAGSEPWAWRLEGHHVSLNFTLRNGDFLTATPLFLGADPARVEKGMSSGLEVFYPEEDLARELLASFTEPVRNHGALEGKPFDEVQLGPDKTQLFTERAGVPPGEMTGAPMQHFMKLLNMYVSVLHPDLVVGTMDGYRKHDVKDLDFVWSGKGEVGKPFYYRIQGVKKGFSIEYVNRGNHVHCLWRDAAQDFGAGPLAAWEQRKAAEQQPSGGKR